MRAGPGLPRQVLAPAITAGRLAASKLPRSRWAGATRAQSDHHDVLVIDATNVMCAAAADRKRWAHAGAPPLPALFGLWVRFLAAVSQAELVVAVFDEPNVSVPSYRVHTAPALL
jgi:hypothetical protein